MKMASAILTGFFFDKYVRTRIPKIKTQNLVAFLFWMVMKTVVNYFLKMNNEINPNQGWFFQACFQHIETQTFDPWMNRYLFISV